MKEGHAPLEYYQQYKENKIWCDRRNIVSPKKQQSYIKEKIAQGYTPHVIIGRIEKPISCFALTLYRQFKEKVFDESTLPMKGKGKPNGYQERRGNQAFKQNSIERETDYLTFKEEFVHIEGDTIVGVHHKSAVITIYFAADPETLSQRALNENSNGLLRKNGLPKNMDFNQVDQAFISSVANKRNDIPAKVLG